jgi:alpha-tubulin suppressor-like RCC1 family protein
MPRFVRFLGVAGGAAAVTLATAVTGLAPAAASPLNSPNPAAGRPAAAARLASRGRPRSQTTSQVAMTWGDNTAGELGDDTLAGRDIPVSVHGLSGVQAIAAGGRHDLALLSDGTVTAWGDDTFGELGNGRASSNADGEHPVPVQGLTGVTAVAAGEAHSLALLGNGTVMAWGDNRSGQLGDGSTRSSSVPVAVSGLTGVTAIAAGDEFSLALLANGTVVSWGTDQNGQLGNGGSANQDAPGPVTGLTGVTAIAAGGEGALALLADGTVMAWGFDVVTPTAVTGLTGVTAVAAGQNFFLALQPNGTVMSWDGGSSTPAPVSGVTGATAIAAGGGFALALTSGGTVTAWGDDNFGQLGNGTANPGGSLGPVTVQGLSGATAISAGGEQAAALTAGTSPPASGRGGPFSSVWRMAGTPKNRVEPGGLSVTFLEGVSAASGTDAWAVGFHSLADTRPLAEHWNGQAWRLAPVPLPRGATTGQLNGVDELSPANVWAVGTSADSSGNAKPLVEHFTGSAWAIVRSPATSPGGVFDTLEAITGTSPGDLWAVGSDGGAALVEHFNGTAWKLSRTVPSLGGFVTLSAVSASSPSDVWAVGDAESGTDGNGRNVAIQWNGHAWLSVPPPCVSHDRIVTRCPEAVINRMSAVAAIGPGDVWATGNQPDTPTAGIDVPYLLHWTGAAWSLVKTPNPGGGAGAFGDVGSLFNGMTALNAGDIWVAGQTLTEDGSFLTLTEHFNGRSWSVSPTLDPGEQNNEANNTLSAIAGAAPHTLFTVGTQSIPDPGFCCEFGLAETSANG